MRVFTNTRLLGLSLIIILGIFFFSLTYHSTSPQPSITATAQKNPITDYRQAAEERRAKLEDEKVAADIIAKRKAEKSRSVECTFWRQQKTGKSAPRIDEKIVEFCELPTESNMVTDSANQDGTTPPQQAL